MADVEIIDLDPKLSPDGTELLEIQEAAGGVSSSFHTPLSNLIGPEGPQGDPGAAGADGSSATATAGTTTTLAPGADATVTNVGTASDAVFDFGIPEGLQGDQGLKGDPGNEGPQGDAATADAGTTTTLPPGNNATVTNIGTVNAAVFDFAIPQGAKGDTGDTGSTGDTGADGVGIPVGGAENQVLIKASAADYDTEWSTPAGGGDVVGPASAVDDRIATFNGASGKAIQDGGLKLTDLATSNQGTLADSAVQPTDNVSVLTNDAGYLDGTTGVEPGDNVSTLTNDAGYGTGDVSGPISAVDNNLAAFNLTSGKVIEDSGVSPASFATAAQGATADTATQPGDNVSTLTNDAGYLDDASQFATAAQGDTADAALPAASYKPYFSGAVLPDPSGYAEGDLFMVVT